MSKSQKMPTLFISHGGGPWPFIPEMNSHYAETTRWLKNLPQTLPEKPKAILSVSGHWEADVFTVSSAAQPPMIYDYGGFPQHTYELKYPAPGSAMVAARVQDLLTHAKIKNAVDSARGFDHGTFVPLMLMYPHADVPVVSMSIESNYDPQKHLDMGKALAPLRDEGVLIIGSGLSYHNMRGFRTEKGGEVSQQFGEWLGKTVTEKKSSTRNQKLAAWEDAPAARLAHPQEDHLIPLMVVAGAAGEDVGQIIFSENVMHVDMTSYQFGG